MKMQKMQFRIGKLAKLIGVEQFVIRFWEKEFKIKITRSDGKQRFYTKDDFNLFKHIKELLYEQGFTITGAKKQLQQKDQSIKKSKIIFAKKPTLKEYTVKIDKLKKQKEELSKQIIDLQKKLLRLRELL